MSPIPQTTEGTPELRRRIEELETTVERYKAQVLEESAEIKRWNWIADQREQAFWSLIDRIMDRYR